MPNRFGSAGSLAGDREVWRAWGLWVSESDPDVNVCLVAYHTYAVES